MAQGRPTVERWQQIEEIFHGALQRDPTEREPYLREACDGDPDLRREVASLLANHQDAIDSKSWPAAAAVEIIADRISLRPGQHLGPYRIDSFLAAGGMGEVYRATDTRLHRQVAIKISAARFSERFEREARVIASLNHPNICTLYDVGPNYLVMEYVEGRTLAERIQRGPIPLADALDIMRQMAAALEEAHQRLVVHRDFKPGNIKIKPDGTVKVLDFGLAKLSVVQAGASANATDSPTLTIATTQAGVLLGTAAYMSPEQARGEPIDKRGDVWAFGVVLWEMLTGKRLFDGKTTSDVLAAVIRDGPDFTKVPPKVCLLLKRCLEKDPQRRLRDIGDAMGIVENTSEAVGRRANWLSWGIGALLLAALLALSFLHFRETPLEPRLMTTSIEAPESTSFEFAFGLNPPALSPDGRRIVFGARGADGKTQLWVRTLDSMVAQPLAGTEGNPRFPFWSPDSRSIAFFADGKLKRVDVNGGSVLALAEAPNAVGGSWSPQHVIVFSSNFEGAFQRVAATGGVPTAATTHEPGHHYYFPWFLPDGRHFLFADQGQTGSSDIQLRVGVLESLEAKTLGPANSNAVYSSGYLLYLRQNTLMAQPFDDQRLATAGDAVPLADHVRTMSPDITLGIFSVAREGLLAYQGAGAAGEQLIWFDRSGKALGPLGDPGEFLSVEFSPDRKKVAVTLRGQDDDIWIYDVARGLPTRFTYSQRMERAPIWSHDGRSIVYASNAKGQFDLYRKAADGTSNEELLYADGEYKMPSSWSPDGKLLLFWRSDPKTVNDIWVLPTGAPPPASGSGSTAFPWLATPFREAAAKFSPDGHWVAYESNVSGRYEIYAAPFPGPGVTRRISNGGGRDPRWRPNGNEIFYVGPGSLMAAEVSINSGSIEVGAIRSLGIAVRSATHRYDVSLDGQRFLVATPREQKSPVPLTLVQNWTALLKK
jgi:Tol biopolymer transport system component/tRNA A-37 threonylcarbamoyl transferase component Bud32